MTTMIAVRLPSEINLRLEALAKRTGRSKTFYVCEAILRQLEDMEDTYVAIERLENPGRRWSMDEIEQGADLLQKKSQSKSQSKLQAKPKKTKKNNIKSKRK